jgi:hypothetical protein
MTRGRDWLASLRCGKGAPDPAACTSRAGIPNLVLRPVSLIHYRPS